MAKLSLRLPNNVQGDFYVDSTCIDCDTCRQLAPSVFAEDGDYSYVDHQPKNAEEERLALHALLACPTASIGTQGPTKAREAMEDFPLLIENEIYYCGFNAESSFGANSYFIRHPEGNWLVDSPRITPYLVKKFTAMGGIDKIFLTHRDDVADAAAYGKKFASQRIIHRLDSSAAAGAEILVEGRDPQPMGQDFLIIPTPGHTRGSCVLLYQNKYLFTGDHLWWSRRTQHLGAGKGVAWHSWAEQIRSMELLLDYDFEWVLPGHGRRVALSRVDMKKELRELVSQMKAA